MRFQVPQFIEVEDKIFGPLTFKQFIYIAGGVGICVILFTFLPKFFALLLSAPIVALAGSLAFYKVNGKPFASLLEAFLKYEFSEKLYVWKKQDKTPVHTEMKREASEVYIPKLSSSKLKDLSWSLDVQDNQNPVTQEETKI
ncbi:PrgI family protein [Candidatus Parcubacteria bacterium]|nr:PrgI family protein [Candidatus Parcubacteria bacterium]